MNMRAFVCVACGAVACGGAQLAAQEAVPTAPVEVGSADATAPEPPAASSVAEAPAPVLYAGGTIAGDFGPGTSVLSIPDAGLASGEDAGPPSPAGLSPTQTRSVITSHTAAIRACYNAARARRRDLAGRVTLTLTVDPDGHVSKTSTTHTMDARVEACIAVQATTWRFPPTGAETRASFPFLFVSDDAGP